MKQLVVVDLMSHVRDFGSLVIKKIATYSNYESTRAIGLGSNWKQEFAQAAGIIISGTPDMVMEVDWADELAGAVHAAAASGIPVLGICFGHQLLAHHYGSKLSSWDKPKVGIAEVQLTGDWGVDHLPVLLTHRDYVEELGPDLQQQGVGGFGGVQAFKHKQLPIWGIQGHPEADAEICRIAEGHDVDHYSDLELDTLEAKKILSHFASKL